MRTLLQPLRFAPLALLVVTSCAGGPAPAYVHAPTPVHGSAPGMRVQRLSDPQDPVRRYAVVFAAGDDILGGLTDLALQEHLGASQITAIGGVLDATLGWYDRDRKLYRANLIDAQAEVTSLVGDIALREGLPVVHLHMNVALADGTVRGGHLLGAHVWPTLEVMVVDSPHALHKEHDDATGIDLIVPDGGH
jgi:predicted DNA-binding protein with PD1-like motif